MHIGKKIKHLVEHSNLQVQQISYALGYKSPQSLYDIYKREHVTTDIIESVSRLLKVPASYFFENDDNLIIVAEEQMEYKIAGNEVKLLYERIHDLENAVKDKQKINELLELELERCKMELDAVKKKLQFKRSGVYPDMYYMKLSIVWYTALN